MKRKQHILSLLMIASDLLSAASDEQHGTDAGKSIDDNILILSAVYHNVSVNKFID